MSATARETIPNATTDLYPSRRGGSYQFSKRLDPVVHGAGEGLLDSTNLSRFERDGFLILKGFFSEAQIKPAVEALHALSNDPDVRQRPEVFTEPNSEAVRSIFALHTSPGPLCALTEHPDLVAIAKQILGTSIYLHQSRVNYKPGFKGKGFFWHSDFETWHVEDGLPRMHTVSASILLTSNDNNNGPLMLVPGSHKRFLSCSGFTPKENYKKSLKSQEIGVPDAKHMQELVDQGGITTATGPAGTVIFFDCNTMHGSNSNITPWPRSNVFAVYNSVENRLVDPFCGLEPRPEFIAHRRHIRPM